MKNNNRGEKEECKENEEKKKKKHIPKKLKDQQRILYITIQSMSEERTVYDHL